MSRSDKVFPLLLIVLISTFLLFSRCVRSLENFNVSINTSNDVDGGIRENFLGSVSSPRIFELFFGKAGAVKVELSFTTDTMTYNGKIFTSEWQEEDYALIQYKENQVIIVGTHRYGTIAGSLYYNKEKPLDILGRLR